MRQRTLLNLGSDFAVATEHWAVLCSRIEQLLERQEVLVELDCPEEVEREAQRIALQLVHRGPEVAAGGTDLQTVDVESLELARPRTVGVEHVGLWAMERLGLRGLLEGLGFNGRQRAVAVGSIIGRMGQPGSERASWRWLCERSGQAEAVDEAEDGEYGAEIRGDEMPKELRRREARLAAIAAAKERLEAAQRGADLVQQRDHLTLVRGLRSHMRFDDDLVFAIHHHRVSTAFCSTHASVRVTALSWAATIRSSPPISAMSETDFGAERVTSRPGRCWTSPSMPRLPSCGPPGTLPSSTAWKLSGSTGPESPNSSAPLPAQALASLWVGSSLA